MKNCDIIRSAYEENLSHALLLNFEDCSCDLYFVKSLIKSILCGKKHSLNQSCPVCEKIKNNSHPDVFYIACDEEKQSTIGVSEVKSLQKELYIFPNESNFKIFVIKNCEFMTIAAQNALLKMLEEPPDYAIFILLCENIFSLLPTVKSRLQRFDVSPILISENHEDTEKLANLRLLARNIGEKILEKDGYETLKLVAEIPIQQKEFSFVVDELSKYLTKMIAESSSIPRQITNLVIFLSNYSNLINNSLNLNLLITRFLSELLKTIRSLN